MRTAVAVFWSELSNVLRSKWIYAYSLILAFFVGGFSYIVDDPRRAELGLVNLLIPLAPLVSILFTTTYWYTSERFTQLLLSQPVSRACLFWSRITALNWALSICLFFGLVLCGMCLGVRDPGLFWLFVATIVVESIFCVLGALIATVIVDRMWGIGLGFAIWFYFVALHDALLLLVLYWFRDYSLQLASIVMCALNPIALLRVLLLMHFDAPLLLGHSGALVRRAVESGAGYWWGAGALALWLSVPAAVGYYIFRRRDF